MTDLTKEILKITEKEMKEILAAEDVEAAEKFFPEKIEIIHKMQDKLERAHYELELLKEFFRKAHQSVIGEISGYEYLEYIRNFKKEMKIYE